MSQELPVLKKGNYYIIKDGKADLIMEDKTKRGLTVKEIMMHQGFCQKQKKTQKLKLNFKMIL